MCFDPFQIVCRCVVLISVALVSSSYSLAENRTMDGQGNNLAHPSWGAAVRAFGRIAPAAYVDGLSEPLQQSNPVVLSNLLFPQGELVGNRRRLSGYVYAFGQLISHDMQHTISGETESVSLTVLEGDEFFPAGAMIPLSRSIFATGTGLLGKGPRQQVNFTTAFLDASPIYGATVEDALSLRGGGSNPSAKLLTSSDVNGDGQNLLPRRLVGQVPTTTEFAAGDDRVNENVVLTAMQTLFMREHNRWVDRLSDQHPEWSNDQLFQRARKLVGAEIQAITYNEFLPALLGDFSPSPDGAYDDERNPSIVNEFPAVFLRVGHSMLTEDFKRIDNNGSSGAMGPLKLQDAFFAPENISASIEMDLLLKGLALEVQEEIDLQLTDPIRAAALGAIDLQRANDHGIARYNVLRTSMGFEPADSFADISRNASVQQLLALAYKSVDEVDAFVGALAEDHLASASVGPLVATAFFDQFSRLRDGDRFYYKFDTDFTAEEIDEITGLSLADVVQLNTGVRNLQENVFFVPEPTQFSAWMLYVLKRRRISRRR